MKIVKRAHWKIKSYFEIYKNYKVLADSLKETTTLRDKPDFNFINDYLVTTLKNNIIKENE